MSKAVGRNLSQLTNEMHKPVTLELLAPARNIDTAMAAVMSGADAVYIGPESHGARRAAANSVDDIRRLVEFANPYGARVYATVNTLVYDREIRDVERLVTSLYNVGVDALIVQDMGILRMDIPPIDLHASTQCDIRTPEKARFLADAGFSRLVLPRELSLDEIAGIRDAVPSSIEIEAFIHGALCVSYSGDCRASFMAGGRSANRGECAQICRLPYDLVDINGNVIVEGRHLLSLRDLNRTSAIQDMAAAGVMSFKIEGRLKEESYVRNTVAWYSRIIDRLVSDSDGRYVRLSDGHSRPGFNPAPEKSFNRGFTTYFLTGKAPAKGMASMETPKAVGETVGRVARCTPKVITASLSARLSNGDGLGYFDQAGIFRGFRLNRVEGDRLYPASPQSVAPGTILYRNRDKEWDDEISAARPSRTINVDMCLRCLFDGRISLSLTDERGNMVEKTSAVAVNDVAVTPQEGPRKRILDKLGGTVYRAGSIVDLAGRLFIPASLLASLRREAVGLLDAARAMTYRRRLRLPEKKDAVYPQAVLSMHDNVANRLAADFYRSHGVTGITAAAEVERPEGETLVMSTRYCIRKEMGRCLRMPGGTSWPSPLFLIGPSGLRMRVDFDCARCGMDIYKV